MNHGAEREQPDGGPGRPGRPVLGTPRALTDEERRIYARIPVKVDYVRHPSFRSPDAEATFFGPDAEHIQIPAWTTFPEAVEEIASPRGRRARLKPREEALLFLRYNYARCRLAELVEAQLRRVTTARGRRMIQWHQRAMKARADLVRANLALVLAMAKRTRIPNVEFGEVVSEGNMALLRAVEKFDVSRGFKFSTYACRAILKSFNRLATKTGRYRQRFPTEYDPDMERSDYDANRHEIQRSESVEAVRELLVQNRARLTEVERTIIMERFAISRESRKTLAEVGRMVGLTNERVRQIQNEALGKIRAVLKENLLAV
jgi:RNA polymerase sigma factor (sigma-70 family)